jgi:hypothetical protein
MTAAKLSWLMWFSKTLSIYRDTHKKHAYTLLAEPLGFISEIQKTFHPGYMLNFFHLMFSLVWYSNPVSRIEIHIIALHSTELPWHFPTCSNVPNLQVKRELIEMCYKGQLLI